MNKNVQNIITIAAIVALVIVSFIAFSGDSDEVFSSEDDNQLSSIEKEEVNSDSSSHLDSYLFATQLHDYMSSMNEELIYFISRTQDSDMFSDAWNRDIKNNIYRLNVIFDDINSMDDPPEELDEAYFYITLAVDYYETSFQFFLNGIETNNVKSLESAIEFLSYGSEHLETATQLISDLSYEIENNN